MIPTKLRIVERINSMTMQQSFHLDLQSLRPLEKQGGGVVKMLADHVDDIYHLNYTNSKCMSKLSLGTLSEIDL